MAIHDITRLIVLLTADSIYDRCETVCFAAVFSGEMMDEAYRKFKETGQEALRLKIALEQLLGRDREMLPQEVRTEYERYLKKRIRPAMEQLIMNGETDQIVHLGSYGWFGEKELDSFLDKARKEYRTAAWLVLLRMKQERYGFRGRDFTL